MKAIALCLAVLAGSAVVVAAQRVAPLDEAMSAFLEADSAREAARSIARVTASGPSFAEVAGRLRAGRAYPVRRTGAISMPSTARGIALDNVVEVPADYTPSTRWPVRVSLHGGVGRQPPSGGERARALANRIPSPGEIVIHPRAWASVEWWRPEQVDNVLRLLDRVKREYNVDESRVYVTGISDGGTGVYFLGMREATPWAACLPLNGHPSVLANPDVGAYGQLHAGNLANCPLYIVNGGRDRLYPAASVEPLVRMLRTGGVPLVFRVHPEAGHDVSWWPEERSRYEAFLASNVRAAHPERVSWETERTDRYNRFRWVVIEALGARPSDSSFGDVNRFEPVPGRELPLYERGRPSGRVDAARNGNTFDLKTRGVRELTLLMPDGLDFARPVRVVVNGRVVHESVVKPDVSTLLEWAARDNDRTMLYGAALRVEVP